MKWMKISLKTTTEAVDYISNLFDELGLEGIQIEDNVPISEEDKKAMYIDILPELPPDDGTAVVSSFVEMERDIALLKIQIEEGLLELRDWVAIGEGTILLEETDDADWIDNWKEFFKPFYVTPDILIKPTWEAAGEVLKDTIVIEMDPGTAFGTGSHETTRLCIESLKKYVTKESRILDVGCGSGILSIIGLKLGAKDSTGTDIDPAAITAAKENMESNGIPADHYRILSGNIIEEESLWQEVGLEAYEIVTANILADVIIKLSNVIARHMKPGGLFISSGIICDWKKPVEEALLQNGFEMIECNQMGDWVSFTAKKPEKK